MLNEVFLWALSNYSLTEKTTLLFKALPSLVSLDARACCMP